MYRMQYAENVNVVFFLSDGDALFDAKPLEPEHFDFGVLIRMSVSSFAF